MDSQMNLDKELKIYMQTIRFLDDSTDDYFYLYDLANDRIYFTEKMIHGFSALFESFTIPILAYFLKTEKGQSHELLRMLCPFSVLLHYSVSSILVTKIMTADFYIKIRCERIS